MTRCRRHANRKARPSRCIRLLQQFQVFPCHWQLNPEAQLYNWAMKNRDAFKNRLKKFVKSSKFLYQVAMTILGKKPVMNGLKKEICGHKNIFESGRTTIFVNCKIDVAGNNNHITIADYCSFSNVTFLIRGNNNRIRISEGVRFNYGGSLHIEDQHCLIQIGGYSTFEQTHIAVTEPGSQVLIGEDCMFAYDIDVRTGDSHSIIDATTRQRINYAKNISIGDHVWVGPHCSILKGVAISRNSVVATRTVLTKSFLQEGIIIGGSPSRILKENITWDRRRIFTNNQQVA
jgi:acetyltransferase-like isoleucine patch superfamily enzyme